MVRVRARPSFVKAISIPTLRRKVAARRSRPDSARGLSGQVLDLATRSPTTSARAPRRSEAIPVHTVRTVCVAACVAACSAACFAMKARTAVATGSASMTPSTASSRLPAIGRPERALAGRRAPVSQAVAHSAKSAMRGSLSSSCRGNRLKALRHGIEQHTKDARSFGLERGPQFLLRVGGAPPGSAQASRTRRGRPGRAG